jgi:hypothetical protein
LGEREGDILGSAECGERMLRVLSSGFRFVSVTDQNSKRMTIKTYNFAACESRME